jgi:hypothetical protein
LPDGASCSLVRQLRWHRGNPHEQELPMPAITRRPFQAALVALGLCLAYAPDAQAQSLSPDDDAPATHQSPAMMYTGISLTTTGIAGLGVGTALAASLSQERGEFAGLGALLVGGAVLIPSSILVHIGIPLWAVGASEPDRPWERATAVPEVRIGPTGGSLLWAF